MKKRKRIIRWILILLLLTVSGILLFFACRDEGRFTPAASPVPDDADAVAIKVLTWNILRGEEEGVLSANWPQRKTVFADILADCDYDIICLQEVLPGQVEFFRTLLTGYDCITAGRQDGQSEGEHGPVFYNADRFELLTSNTFWLSTTPETPSKGWGEVVPRICTWVELADAATGARFRVYNTHLHVNPYAQFRGAELLAERIRQAGVPVILTGDMNAPPDWPPLRALEETGLAEADTSGALTYHVNGKGIRCLDHILHSREWTVRDGGLIKDNVNDTYPSDHFGLWATLRLTVEEKND